MTNDFLLTMTASCSVFALAGVFLGYHIRASGERTFLECYKIYQDSKKRGESDQ